MKNKRLEAMVTKLPEYVNQGAIPGMGRLLYGRCFYSDVTPALRTRSVNDNNDFIIEPIGCAMRGRNPENPSESGRSNGKYKQRIEMGSNISNTITSVQKDALVAEPQILTVGYLNEGKHQQDFVQHEDGISRAICCGTHGSGPHLTKTIVTEPLRIPQATKQGYIEVPPGSVFDASYPNSQTRRGRVQDGGQTSPTLMAGGEAPCYYEGKAETIVIDDYNQRIPQDQDVIGTVTTQFGNPAPRHGYKVADLQQSSYRIRKLTPRECFRLMGVSETNIDKIQQSGVSQSQQYKMAGNSIVVDVLEHIFRKMFIETGQESQQLSLF